MIIGIPVREYTVEPLEQPVPSEPMILPDPVVTPEEEPVTVEP